MTQQLKLNFDCKSNFKNVPCLYCSHFLDTELKLPSVKLHFRLLLYNIQLIMRCKILCFNEQPLSTNKNIKYNFNQEVWPRDMSGLNEYKVPNISMNWPTCRRSQRWGQELSAETKRKKGLVSWQRKAMSLRMILQSMHYP